MARGDSTRTRRKSSQFAEDLSERRLGVRGLFGIDASIPVHSERNQAVNFPDFANTTCLAADV
jgi:hypothetical protein